MRWVTQHAPAWGQSCRPVVPVRVRAERPAARRAETLQLWGQGARSSGVNFAIGVDVVRACVPRLIVYGTSSGVSAPRGRAPMSA